jgi:hypothetical protein
VNGGTDAEPAAEFRPAKPHESIKMKVVAWCLLFVFCWPLAVLAILLWPLLWLLSLPFRLLGYRDGPSARTW